MALCMDSCKWLEEWDEKLDKVGRVVTRISLPRHNMRNLPQPGLSFALYDAETYPRLVRPRLALYENAVPPHHHRQELYASQSQGLYAHRAAHRRRDHRH